MEYSDVFFERGPFDGATVDIAISLTNGLRKMNTRYCSPSIGKPHSSEDGFNDFILPLSFNGGFCGPHEGNPKIFKFSRFPLDKIGKMRNNAASWFVRTIGVRWSFRIGLAFS